MLFYGTSDEHRPNMMKWVNQVKLELYLNMSSLCWRFVISIKWHKCAYVIHTFFLYIPFTDFMWYTIKFRTVSSHYSRKLYWKKQNDRTDSSLTEPTILSLFYANSWKWKKSIARKNSIIYDWLTKMFLTPNMFYGFSKYCPISWTCTLYTICRHLRKHVEFGKL